MNKILTITFLFFSITTVIFLTGCATENDTDTNAHNQSADTIAIAANNTDTANVVISKVPGKVNSIEKVSQKIEPDSIVAFAKTLIGIPYLYASINPVKGFDCSGFITYVFNHFNITVPRSSVDFTNYGKTIDSNEAKPGDLILFTGTDSTIHVVGHMGIIESKKEKLIYFIHASSGKAKGVVITPLENYYRSRFVKVIRVFPEDYFNK